MRVQKQPSGGRGEYEIAESFSGIEPSDLFNLEIWIDLGSLGTKKTNVALTPAQGKNRLRLLTRPGIHLHRQIHAALLLPKPIRDEAVLEAGQPVIMRNRCLMREMPLANVQLAPDHVVISPDTLHIENGSGETAVVEVRLRTARVRQLLDRRSEFPPRIAGVLEEFSIMFASTSPVDSATETLVETLMAELAGAAPGQEIEYAEGTDVLSPLQEMLDLNTAPSPPPPADLIPLDSIHPDDTEVRRRENERKLRWINERGAASRRFSRDVKLAYDSTCIMCGLRLPSSRDCRTPGVDAAHIFAWHHADLDVVPNGLCLCKLHHWAFDSYLLTIVPNIQNYSVVLTQSAQRAFGATTAACQLLSRAVGVVPVSRLPTRQADWPNPEWITRRNDELGIVAIP